MARILIIDDHIETCRVMTMLVKHLGHEGASVFSGPEGIDYLSTHPADLVILDVMMPGMDGLEVLRRLREADKTKKTPVIMMTAVTDPATRRQAMSLGANDYWIKATIEVQELERRINLFTSDNAAGGHVQRVIERIAIWLDERRSQQLHPA